MKKLFLLLFIGLLVSCSQNEQLSLDRELSAEADSSFIDAREAFSLATILSPEIDRSENRIKSSADAGVKSIETFGENNYPEYYIVNYENNGGFVILSADKRIPAILAYSPEGNFEVDKDMPSGLVAWMQDTQSEIQDVRSGVTEAPVTTYSDYICDAVMSLKLPDESVVTTRRAPANCYPSNKPPTGGGSGSGNNCNTQTTIGPLLKTEWHQWSGFNDQIDYYCEFNSKPPAGCVAISTAQIMYYHKKPSTFDWNAMALDYGTTETSRLIADIGLKIGMDYGCDGSGSNTKKTPDLLKNHYGYGSASFKDSFDKELIKQELYKGYPVILGAQSDTGGHSWVCDGYIYTNMCTYTTLHFFMNWGWMDAKFNGVYALDMCNPGGTNYYRRRGMAYNIRP